MFRFVLTLWIISIGYILCAQNGSMGFVENNGQIYDQHYEANTDVKYLYHSPGLNVQLRNNGFSYDTYTYTSTPNELTPEDSILYNSQSSVVNDVEYKFHRIDITWLGGNQNPTIIAELPATDHINVYNALVPSGINGIRHYSKVTYKDIYPGIDLEFTCNQTTEKPLEYNFIVHPGADASLIKLKYSGANQTYLNEGNLIVATANGSLTESIPHSFIAESNETVDVSYAANNNIVSFSIAAYNSTQTLIIDPVPTIIWALHYGASQSAVIKNAHTDSTGMYIVGVNSSNLNYFIATSGAYQINMNGASDIFLAKFSMDGILQWGTHYGGPATELGNHITADDLGNVYVVAETWSENLASPGAYQYSLPGVTNALFIKFDPSGARLWATYFGGSVQDKGINLATDRYGNVFFSGVTRSNNGIAGPNAHQDTLRGFNDIFLVKFSGSGVYQWSTYFGGEGGEVDYELACDTAGNVFLMGNSGSFNLISTPGSYQQQNLGVVDAILAKFSPTGVLQWATYFGGSAKDEAEGMIIDPDQNILISGNTESTDLPTTPASYQQFTIGGKAHFCAKFDNNGNLLWTTYIDGPGDEDMADIGTNPAGDILITGRTNSTTNIASPNALHPTLIGADDIFIAKFNKLGGLKWATYFGTAWYEQVSSIHGFGKTDMYLIGSTNGNFTNIGFPPVTGGGVILAKFASDTCSWPIRSTVGAVSCSGGSDGTISLNPTGAIAPYTYLWSTGDPTAQVSNLPSGYYTVTVSDDNNCLQDTVIFIPRPAPDSTIVFDTICKGQTLFGYSDTGVYSDTFTASTGCDSIRVLVLEKVSQRLYVIDTQLCANDSLWIGGQAYTTNGTYYDTISISPCREIVQYNVTVVPGFFFLPPTVLNPSCSNTNDGAITVSVSGGSSPYSYQWSNIDTVPSISGLSLGNYSVTVIDDANCNIDTTFSLTATAISVQTFTDTVCAGQTLYGYGVTGVYNDTFTTLGGCDSIRTLNLEVLSSIVQVIDTQICAYDSLWINSQAYTSNGSYYDTISITPCLEVVQYNLTVLPAIQVLAPTVLNPSCNNTTDGAITVSVSGGSSPYGYLWSTSETTTSVSSLGVGTYTVTVTDAANCTKDTTFTLTAMPTPVTTITDTVCAGQTLYGYGVTGVYNDTFTAAGGCDSIRTLNLEVLPSTFQVVDTQICAYDSLWIGGQAYTANGTYYDTLSISPCIALVQYNLTVLPAIQALAPIVLNPSCSNTTDGAIDVSVIGGSSPYDYLWSTSETTPSVTSLGVGTYTVTVTDAANCTKDTTFTLTATPIAVTTVTDTVCAGQTLHGHGATGVYNDTFTSSNGCDSIRVLNLTVENYVTLTIDTQLCHGTDIVVGNSIYNTTGTYTDTIQNGQCPSIINTNVTVLPAINIDSIGGRITAIANLPYSYSAPNIANATYQWEVLSGNITGGQGTDTINVVWDRGNGGVWLYITLDGCKDSLLKKVYIESPNGVDELISPIVNVYPNPTNGTFKVELLNINGGNNVMAQLFDIQGRSVWEKQVKTNTSSFDISGLANGVYILQINHQDFVKVVRVAKY